MTSPLRTLELLAPAANAETAIQAILHGADAVYIGASSHGARKNAANSIEDLRRVVEFAHRYRARVYVTVNTIVYDNELDHVQQLCWQLYEAGADALIVQDLGILRLQLPPIALHASTQIDTRTVEKAIFLEKAGFSQIVLARELGMDEITEICHAVTVPVECFVHGALCVSYSGRCHISQAVKGRSANRGECSQMCRLPYDLVDAAGNKLAVGKHLLSLRDFNMLQNLGQMIEAGVQSFKIEGRLKDVQYVKNVTAAYSQALDRYIAAHPGRFRRGSFGKSTVTFTPALEKSFNRGFTTYFTQGRQPQHITSPLTPKSMGEPLGNVSELNNGDGVSWFDREDNYIGVQVNRVEGTRIITPEGTVDARGLKLHRTFDNEWNKKLSRQTATRQINLVLGIDESSLSGKDERGVEASVPLDVIKDKARKPMDPTGILKRTGNTIYNVSEVINHLDPTTFIPASQLTALRQRLLDALDRTNEATYAYDRRRKEDKTAHYPLARVDFRENVSNRLAADFYKAHGVDEIQPAIETGRTATKSGMVLMTTRHCILREMGCCLRRTESAKHIRQPLHIVNGNNRFKLRFVCDRCEMEVLGE